MNTERGEVKGGEGTNRELVRKHLQKTDKGEGREHVE